MNVIETNGITKSFGKQQVLKGISFSVKKGEIFTLLGENGAGKSTLINILTTLSKPSGGFAKVFDHDLQQDPDQIRHLISLNSQSITLDDEFTGYQNLRLIAKLLGITNIKGRIDSVSNSLNLTEFINNKVSTYSGGMKRRLDVAASLLADTDLLFLDEPSTGVDPKNRLEIWKIIKELRDQGKTIFLTTQYLDEADRLSDRIAFIHDGKISLIGTPQQLKQQAHHRQQIMVPQASIKLASQALAAKSINFNIHEQAIELDEANLQLALKTLLAADIMINETTPIDLTLEEVFLNATTEDPEE